MNAMWLMLQADTPGDFVVATGEQHSVREFCEIAFGTVGLNLEDYVGIDPRFYRPAEVETLLGDPSKARTELGWETQVTFEQLVTMMVEEDLHRVEREIKLGS